MSKLFYSLLKGFFSRRKEFASTQGLRGIVTLSRETTVSKLFFFFCSLLNGSILKGKGLPPNEDEGEWLHF